MSSDQRRAQTQMAMVSAHVAPTSYHKYDVFLSFRGDDARHTVADVVYHSLVDAGFSVFRDNEGLPVGGIIGLELERAIDDSWILLPILSEGYANSPWCLQELARMVKRWRESAGHEIAPIFYGVSPSDVEHQRGSYRDDLRRHKKDYGEETVREWREALKAVGKIKGWDARHFKLGELTKDLVGKLSSMLKKRQKVLPHYLVGIDDRVTDVMQLLDCGSPEIRFLTVHDMGGMGGISKTILAKAIYNKIATRFDGRSFLSDVRLVFRVNIGCCKECRRKLTQILDEMEGVELVDMKIDERLVEVRGDVDPVVIKKAIRKHLGKKAELVERRKTQTGKEDESNNKRRRNRPESVV